MVIEMTDSLLYEVRANFSLVVSEMFFIGLAA